MQLSRFMKTTTADEWVKEVQQQTAVRSEPYSEEEFLKLADNTYIWAVHRGIPLSPVECRTVARQLLGGF